MQDGAPRRTFQPISLHHDGVESKAHPQVKSTLFKPIARTADAEPIFFDGHRSGNTLVPLPLETAPRPDQIGPVVSLGVSSNEDDATQLDLSKSPRNDKPERASSSESTKAHSHRSTVPISDRIAQKPISRACSSSVSFHEEAYVDSLPSLNAPDFKEATKTDSILSEATVLSSSLGQSPTIASIHTINSNFSSRGSDILKPIPRRAKESGDIPDVTLATNIIGEEPSQDTTQNSLHVQRQTSFDLSRIPIQGRKSAPFLHRKHSDTGANFRKVVSAHRDREDPNPWTRGGRNIFSSSSSSTTEPEDAAKISKKSSSGQKSGDGNRLSLRLFERRANSHSNSNEDDDNPWFHANSSLADDADSPDYDDVSPAKPVKAKKKRMKKLSLKFHKEGKGRDVNKSLKFAASSGSIGSTSTALSEDELSLQANDERNPSMEYSYLEQALKRTLSEKPRLEEVLDKVIRLPDRPKEEISHILYKFLSTAGAVEKGMGLVLLNDDWDEDEVPWLNFQTESAAYVPYRELLVHIYVNGPKRLKKAIVNHSKVRMQMLSFLGDEKQRREQRDTRIHSYKVNCVAKILNSLLEENRVELTDYIAARKGCLQAIARNNIHVPEVVEFVSQLCAANALSDTSNEGNRYGAPNAAGIVLLEKEGICNLLVQTFVESSSPEISIVSEELRWHTQVMTVRCLLELSKRCVSIPPFSKANCSYSNKFIKSVNRALQSINSFENLGRVEFLLEAGFAAVDGTGRDSSREIVALRNNAAVCALSFVAELLEMVHDAANSKSVVTQRTVGGVNVSGLEELILSHASKLKEFIQSSGNTVVMGRLKIAIVKTFCSLLSSRLEETRSRVCQSSLPALLLEQLSEHKLSSTLHRYIVDCIKVSMEGDCSHGLHKAWFVAMQSDGGLMEELVEFVRLKDGEICEGDERRCEEWNSYRSTVVEIGFIVSNLSQNLTRSEFRGMFTSEEGYKTFTNVIEPGLRKVEEGRQGACGGPKPDANVVSVLANAESLAARLDDVNAV